MAKGTGASIGSKYGSSVDNFQKELKSGADKIMIDWANESIAIMRKILSKKTRIGDRGKLIADLQPKPYPMDANGNIRIEIVTMQDHWDYVDKGVQGVYNKSKAPNSPYKFRNLGTPDSMVDSFKDYISRVGLKTAKIKGKSTRLYKTNNKTKTKTAKMDVITQAAKGMAIATKIGGLKAVNYVEPAVGKKRLNILSKSMSKEIGRNVLASIVVEF
jgi:hypothetical protein